MTYKSITSAMIIISPKVDVLCKNNLPETTYPNFPPIHVFSVYQAPVMCQKIESLISE